MEYREVSLKTGRPVRKHCSCARENDVVWANVIALEVTINVGFMKTKPTEFADDESGLRERDS